MNEAKLKRGQVLLETIKTTKQGLANLKKLKLEKQNDKRQTDNSFDDSNGLYTLCIGEYSDMSGTGATLSRYGGNMELLDVIIETLGKQLDAYEEEFESM